MIEKIIVGAVVVLAAVFLVYSFVKSSKGETPCGKSCPADCPGRNKNCSEEETKQNSGSENNQNTTSE
ncbi:Virus attachment protein p12 family protein [Sedimentisphaera cyanobacteriorum]|uniref:Virus attachment protein p12 family protein n=1 Tax=Sedimentisphaera cyanobacteriorum TaxID=1940790 RepID=A0A1Q2HQA6_9BACT|nr:FeoB-associated Cys-rich membrane protein [Sedimentisphaera cyanobacteriorum]AQQ09627.1 Virus attachment protein p12 family protein [Sedimentisphaera cyanobacteriorum]